MVNSSSARFSADVLQHFRGSLDQIEVCARLDEEANRARLGSALAS
jgi:hypothetical protein